MDRPIPAFYCCYLLRSTVRHSSLYVGSTPNPARRLAQHNGLSKGGAIRTSRPTLRPWEMVCIVTGFPSNIAALQFEWAWQNPHLTRRIPPSLRLTQPEPLKPRKKRPAKPRVSLADRLGNLHLLLRVKSFARWPLQVRFFSEDVFGVWQRWTEREPEGLRQGVGVVFDPKRRVLPAMDAAVEEPDPFQAPPSTQVPRAQSQAQRKKAAVGNGGVEGVDVGYAALKPHVEKSLGLVEDFSALQCAVCEGKIALYEDPLVATCPTPDCRAASHLTCLASHFLASEGDRGQELVPTEGECPECKARLRWVDVVRELSLRVRGGKEVVKLLKKPRGGAKEKKAARKGKKAATTAAALPSSSIGIDAEDEDEDGQGYSPAEDDSEDEEHGLRLRAPVAAAADDLGPPIDYEDYFYRFDDDDDDMMSVTSAGSEAIEERMDGIGSREIGTGAGGGRLEIVIEDSELDDDDHHDDHDDHDDGGLVVLD